MEKGSGVGWQTTSNANAFIYFYLFILIWQELSNQHTYTWLARKVNGPPKRRTRQRQLFQHVFLTFVYVSVEIKENFFKIKTNNAIKGEWKWEKGWWRLREISPGHRELASAEWEQGLLCRLKWSGCLDRDIVFKQKDFSARPPCLT